MPLTQSERETLAGPSVVGCILGSFLGFLVFGLESEHFGAADLGTVVHAVEAFLIGIALSVVPLGLLPVIIARVRRRGERDDP
jgi:membrane-associated HD superfamily phosphohydrolase